MVVSKTVTVDKGMMVPVVVSSSRLLGLELESRVAMRFAKRSVSKEVQMSFQVSRSRLRGRGSGSSLAITRNSLKVADEKISRLQLRS